MGNYFGKYEDTNLNNTQNVDFYKSRTDNKFATNKFELKNVNKAQNQTIKNESFEQPQKSSCGVNFYKSRDDNKFALNKF